MGRAGERCGDGRVISKYSLGIYIVHPIILYAVAMG